MNSIRLALGAAVFSVPILTGFAYTASATVGLDGILSGDTEDQWTIAGNDELYTLDREQVDGVVTLIVTDENGNIVSEDDYPDFVEEAAAEFGAENWMPEEDNIIGTLVKDIDGTTCYDGQALAAEADGEVYGVTQSGPEGSFAIEVDADGQVDAASFEGEVADEVFSQQQDNDAPYSEIEGAQQLSEC